MRQKSSRDLSWNQWLGAVGGGLGIVATLVALLVAYRGELRSRTAEQQQFIQQTYGAYLETDRFQLDHPEIAHELVTPDEYCDEVNRVRAAYGSATGEEKARMRLREEGLAWHVFSVFAQLVHAQQASASTRDNATSQFIQGELEAFGQDILPNPRLVYFWRDEKGSKYYDSGVRSKYLALIKRPLASMASDECGPFPDEANRQSKRCMCP
jgi:hypothetical protein